MILLLSISKTFNVDFIEATLLFHLYFIDFCDIYLNYIFTIISSTGINRFKQT